MIGEILLPQQRKRHPTPLQLTLDRRPIDGATLARTGIGNREQPTLQLGIVQLRRYRPGDPHQRGSAHIVSSLRLAGTGRRADPAVTHSERVLQMKHLTNLTHRQSLRRHRQSPLGEGAAIR
jgi:hypothetical protein